MHVIMYYIKSERNNMKKRIIITLIVFVIFIILIIYAPIIYYNFILSFFFFYSYMCLFFRYLKDDYMIKKEIKDMEKRNSETASNIQYYRDIIDNYSPMLLGYCMSKSMNIEDDSISTILYLKYKNVISMNNNKIKIINNNYKLLPSEKFLIDSYNCLIKGNKDNIFNNKHTLKVFKKLLFNDLINTGLMNETVKKASQHPIEEVLYVSLCFVLFLIIAILVFNKVFFDISSLSLLALAYVGFLNICNMLDYYSIKSFNISLVKTEKGIELSNKLYALKRYLNDFSLLSEKQLDEIKLWDNYIILAIIFDLKGNLDNESHQIYLECSSKYKRTSAYYKEVLALIYSVALYILMYSLLLFNLFIYKNAISTVLFIIIFILIICSMIANYIFLKLSRK